MACPRCDVVEPISVLETTPDVSRQCSFCSSPQTPFAPLALHNGAFATPVCRFIAAYARVPETRYIFNNKCTDILAIAAAMLQGEIAYRQGHHDSTFAHLRQAVALDDSLPYDEPWGWMQPARHALGALLLEQDRVAEAMQVYQADLGLDNTLRRASQHPDNVWSLHGYVECLHRLGQHAEATAAQTRLDLALARADVAIRASCFCRVGEGCCT